MPDWIGGCNKIDILHPTVVNELIRRNISLDIISRDIIKTIDFETFVKENKIIGTKFLKLDTEGHDTVILNNMLDFYEKNDNIFNLPHRISFESNILTNQDEISKMIFRLQNHGYKLESTGEDTTLYL